MQKAEWLVYAEEIKAKILRLEALKDFSAERRRIVFETHDVARNKYEYPGTLAEWDHAVENCEPDQKPPTNAR